MLSADIRDFERRGLLLRGGDGGERGQAGDDGKPHKQLALIFHRRWHPPRFSPGTCAVILHRFHFAGCFLRYAGITTWSASARQTPPEELNRRIAEPARQPDRSADVRDSSFERADGQNIGFLAREFLVRAARIRLPGRLAGSDARPRFAGRRFRRIALSEALGQSQCIGEARSGHGPDLRNHPATIMIQNIGGDVPQEFPIMPFANGVLGSFHGVDELLAAPAGAAPFPERRATP